MDLIASTWMTRSLGEAVASVALEANGSVLVGGWDGALKRWNEQGDLLWATKLNDRVNEVQRHEGCLVATAGLHVVCLDYETGETRWSHALEGSADAVLIHDGIVYAVSSVYDIEHNDFIESAVWSYDLDGAERFVQRMDERPWTIMSCEGEVWLGLGRPKCGLAKVNPDGTILHIPGPVDSPVTSGAFNSTKLLFGHADGTVSDRSSSVVHALESGVESLVCLENGAVVAEETGDLHAFAKDGKSTWTQKGDAIESHCVGFEVNGKPTHWIARWSGVSGTLVVADQSNGATLAEAPSLHVRFLKSAGKRVIAGCENGDVHVWEMAVFERRMSAKKSDDDASENPRKSALQDKLRKLRER
tara:strand:+ start:7187 stop:8266 length:1080 start_codon:yes stop_codon:yes gene_type:complete